MLRKTIRPIFSVFLLVGFLHYGTGCLKEEYSYEGGPPQDSTINRGPVAVPPDTTLPADTALQLASCAFCKYATSLSNDQWNFRYDTSFFCGAVTNAVMTLDKDAFTFSGPSACTPGTGLIITAYFNSATFDADRAGITSTQVTFQYYDDNNSQNAIFTSGAATQFSMTINQFEKQSGIAIGRFSGTALTSRGKMIAIKEGNFKMRLQ